MDREVRTKELKEFLCKLTWDKESCICYRSLKECQNMESNEGFWACPNNYSCTAWKRAGLLDIDPFVLFFMIRKLKRDSEVYM